MTAPRRFNWRVFIVLWLASILGMVAIVPYSLTLQGITLENWPLAIPPFILIPIQLAEQAVFFGIATAAGLFLAYRIGLGAPILEAKLAGEKVGQRVRSILLPAIALGVIAGLIIIGLEIFIFTPALRAELGDTYKSLLTPGIAPPAWQGFLASFYGGIDEEILLRLFVLSLLAFLGKFISHTTAGRPTLAVLWIANILAAVLFGLGHLPAIANLVPLTPVVTVRAIVLNGLAGLAFGYLYFTRGIESAMLSHFCGDIILHVVAAL